MTYDEIVYFLIKLAESKNYKYYKTGASIRVFILNTPYHILLYNNLNTRTAKSFYFEFFARIDGLCHSEDDCRPGHEYLDLEEVLSIEQIPNDLKKIILYAGLV